VRFFVSIPYTSGIFLTHKGGKVRAAFGISYRVSRLNTMPFMHRVGFIAFVLSISLANTRNAVAQLLDTRTITIPETRYADLQWVFQEVQMQSGLMFVFQPTLTDPFKHQLITAGTYTVREFLKMAFIGTPIDFSGDKTNIIVYRRPVIYKVWGRVADLETGEPLHLASVLMEDSTRGTSTDENGEYFIEVYAGETLTFSYAGRKPQKMVVRRTGKVNVSLEAITLETVTVNTGYYSVANEQTVGNISTVSEKQFERSPIANPLQGIQGRMPGVFIEQISGVPGSGYTVRIRGRNSLREEGNNPLYIIDGVPYPSFTLPVSIVGGDILPRSNPLTAIDPANVERIDVLKDADATAIYGSRGANGVIIITTKRSELEGPRAEARIYRGIGQIGHRIDLLNSQQWLTMRKEAFTNDQVVPTSENAHDLVDWDTTRNTDWQDKLIGGNGYITNANLSVHGGDRHTKFLLAGDYRKETTVFPGNFDYVRASTFLNLEHKSRDGRFHLSLTPHYMQEKIVLPVIDLTSQAISLSPVAPDLYTNDRELNWENDTWWNPLASTVQTYESKTSNFIISNTASYRILSGLHLRTGLGYSAIARNEIRLNPIRSYSPSEIADGITGMQIYDRNRLTSLIAEPQLEYALTIQRAKVNFLIGATYQYNSQQGETAYASGYTSDAVIRDLGSAPVITPYSSIDLQYKYAGLFGRINYILKNRYILNLTARRDGSSRFGTSSQFATFGAIGAGWIFTNEAFLEKWERLSFGKLRFSYGTTGSDQINDYGYLGLSKRTPFDYDGKGLISDRPENNGYSWALNKKMEFGLALGFFKNRIQIDISYYRNRTSQQLGERLLPKMTGFATAHYNRPITVQNSGLELMLSTTQIASEHVFWTTSVNMTMPRSKLVRYDGLAQSSDKDNYMIGSPVDVKLLYHYTGVDPNNGNFNFQDRNNDGLDFSDRYPVAYGPKLYGGIDNVIRYRNFELSLLFQFVKQTRQALVTFFPPPGVQYHNQPVKAMQRWRKEGDVSSGQRFSQDPDLTHYLIGTQDSDMMYEDASYVRLKSAALYYTIAKPTLRENISLKSLRVFVMGQNLITFTGFHGLDPESLTPRVLPPLRILTTGIELNL
jgi:TonB-dependent starch-binding outer membrane protein SusC